MSINCVLKGTNISLSNGHKVIEKLKVKENLVDFNLQMAMANTFECSFFSNLDSGSDYTCCS